MNRTRLLSSAFFAATLAACAGGGPAVTSNGPAPATSDCTGSCATAASLLSVADVQQVIAQGVAEAQARGVKATIAVVDRVGNVLAIFKMTGAAATFTINGGQGFQFGNGNTQHNKF